MKTPEERYQTDITFRRLVDSLEHLIHTVQLTPSEIRDAAMLAAIHYESRVTRSWFVVDETVAHDEITWRELNGTFPYREAPE